MTQGLFVGLTTLDVIHTLDQPPAPNIKVPALSSVLLAGGPAAVAAITFAALGGRARLITAIGTGPSASLVHADLASAGVQVIDLAPEGYEIAPSTAIVARATGDRLVVSGSAHTPELAEPGALLHRDDDAVLIDGYLPVLGLAAAAAAARAGVPLVVDAGSHKPMFDQAFRFATDIICSGDYRHPQGGAVHDLLHLGPGLVAASHGPDPIQWWDAGGRAGEIQVPQVSAINTLGAGDVLHGAYAWAKASGYDFVAALTLAAQVASQKVATADSKTWRTLIHVP